MAKTMETRCSECREPYERNRPVRGSRNFCSSICRSRNHRKRHRLVSTNAAAEVAGVNPRTIRRAIQRGDLTAQPIEAHRLIVLDREAVVQWRINRENRSSLHRLTATLYQT